MTWQISVSVSRSISCDNASDLDCVGRTEGSFIFGVLLKFHFRKGRPTSEMAITDFLLRLATCFIITGIGSFWSCIAISSVVFSCFKKGFGKVFQWKDRRNSEPPLHYKAWDVETRKSPGPSTKRWNHAYVTVPETGIRFHYVYSGKVPSDIAISDIDGETVKLPDDGNATGGSKPKLMICAHGFPENWFSWRHVLRHFDEPNEGNGDYFVAAIDMRGYGDSDKPDGYKSYHIKCLASDIKGIALALGYEKFVLVGHDWGAVVSWKVAKFYPESVEKLIVMNGPEEKAAFDGLKARPGQFLKSWYMFFYQIPYLADMFLKLSDYAFVKGAFNGRTGGIRTSENRLTDEEIEVFKYSLRHSTTAPINYYRAMLWPFAQPGPPLKYPRDIVEGDPLHRVPVLVIWGDADAFLVKEIAENVLKYINPSNGSKVVFIEGASHWVQQDYPRETISQMVDFLK